MFGIPNDDWGEEVKAVIEPVEGVDADAALETEIMAYCAEQAGQVQVAQDPSTSPPRCHATPTASSTSASCATRIGKGSNAPSRCLAGRFGRSDG